MDEPNRPSKSASILLLEDSNLDAELIGEALQATGLDIVLDRAVGRPDFARALSCAGYDLILSDFVLPGYNGMAALAEARKQCPDTPFVFVSGALGEEIAVEALKRGATDYVLKHRLERLPATVLRALAEAEERAERRRAEQALHRLLDERTALLHELDHRVKNNLQLLLSLVGYESRRSGTQGAASALERIRRHIEALSCVYRTFDDSFEVRSFDARRFTLEVIQEFSAGRACAPRVRDELRGPVLLPRSQAAPFALLVSEVIFTWVAERGAPEFSLGEDEGAFLLEMRDASRTAGTHVEDIPSEPIVQALARQLDATVHADASTGRLVLRVPVPTGGGAPAAARPS